MQAALLQHATSVNMIKLKTVQLIDYFVVSHTTFDLIVFTLHMTHLKRKRASSSGTPKFVIKICSYTSVLFFAAVLPWPTLHPHTISINNFYFETYIMQRIYHVTICNMCFDNPTLSNSFDIFKRICILHCKTHFIL